MIKDLIIDGELYAKYQIEDNMLFLKMIIKYYPMNVGKSEDWLVEQISKKEGKQFAMVAYLNV